MDQNITRCKWGYNLKKTNQGSINYNHHQFMLQVLQVYKIESKLTELLRKVGKLTFVI